MADVQPAGDHDEEQYLEANDHGRPESIMEWLLPEIPVSQSVSAASQNH
jgi:hypothetical protein